MTRPDSIIEAYIRAISTEVNLPDMEESTPTFDPMSGRISDRLFGPPQATKAATKEEFQ